MVNSKILEPMKSNEIASKILNWLSPSRKAKRLSREHYELISWLVHNQRPQSIIDLYFERAELYLTACRAIEDSKIQCRFYSIVDRHPDQPYELRSKLESETISEYNKRNRFSKCIGNELGQALNLIDDKMIDVLLINGKQDPIKIYQSYITWLPKIKRSGIVVIRGVGTSENNQHITPFLREMQSKHLCCHVHHGGGSILCCLGSPSDTLAKAMGLDENFGTSKLELNVETTAREPDMINERSEEPKVVEDRAGDIEPIITEVSQAPSKDAIEKEALIRIIEGYRRKTARFANEIQLLEQKLEHIERVKNGYQCVIKYYSAKDKKQEFSATQESDIITKSGLFDAKYYLTSNQDVVDYAGSIHTHYLNHGHAEGRAASEFFDTAFYTQTYKDSIPQQMNPLVHFVCYGAAQSFLPLAPPITPRHALDQWSKYNISDELKQFALDIIETGLFDPHYYLAQNKDVADSGTDPLIHYVAFGSAEERKPNKFFDTALYKAINKDVAVGSFHPLIHFAEYGFKEGRAFSAVHVPNISSLAYHSWVENYQQLTLRDERLIRAKINAFKKNPKISVIMPVYNTNLAFLKQAIASVKRQIYKNWELCIANDASTHRELNEYLAELAATDDKIKIVSRQCNGHISAASNSALELATGDFVALMDHDDLLAPEALYEVVNVINKHENVKFIYSDEDHVDEYGIRSNPHFKTEFNIDLLLGQNYINHFAVISTDEVTAAGRFRLGFEGSQDYDLFLRVIDRIDSKNVKHVDRVLYHWRNTSDRENFSQTFALQCMESARSAIADHLGRRNEPGTVVAHNEVQTWHRVLRTIPQPRPLVSIVVPTKDNFEILEKCCDGVLNRTTYQDIELVIIDHESAEPKTKDLLFSLSKNPKVKIIPFKGDFNYSKMNNLAVEFAKGSIIALMNNDVDVINRDWLSEMVSYAVLPEVGAVGAKLLYDNNKVQHGGVILGPGGVAGHFFHGLDDGAVGYMGRAVLTSTVSAVTAACLVLRKEVFELVGGFDEENLKVAFNDVDLCLKIRELGFRNVFIPHAKLYHYESYSRGSDQVVEKIDRFNTEISFMKMKWGDVLQTDPFYNANLDIRSADFTLSSPPRATKSWEVS